MDELQYCDGSSGFEASVPQPIVKVIGKYVSKLGAVGVLPIILQTPEDPVVEAQNPSNIPVSVLCCVINALEPKLFLKHLLVNPWDLVMLLVKKKVKKEKIKMEIQ